MTPGRGRWANLDEIPFFGYYDLRSINRAVHADPFCPFCPHFAHFAHSRVLFGRTQGN